MTITAERKMLCNKKRRLINKAKSCIFFLACMSPIITIAVIGNLFNKGVL